MQLLVIRTSRDDVSVSTTLLNITYIQVSVLHCHGVTALGNVPENILHHMTDSK